MATVGNRLTSPEDGWKRVPCYNCNVRYSEGFYFGNNSNAWSSGIYLKANSIESPTGEIYFSFYGDEFRIIGGRFPIYSANVKVYLDGELQEDLCNQYSSSNKYQIILFERLNLERKVHLVRLVNTELNTLGLDAIDINDNGYMCNCNGKKLDVTPVMTGANAPSPCMATSSGDYDEDSSCYRAFNSINKASMNVENWRSPNNIVSGWIQLDFGVKTKINGMIMQAKKHSESINDNIYDVACMPKIYQVLGSDDGVNYDVIYSNSNDAGWTKNESRCYDFVKNCYYRYYKLNIEDVNGGTFIAIQNIRFTLNTDTQFYLLDDNGVYKNIDENGNLFIIDDISILNDFPNENTCIYDISSIVDEINNITGTKRLICSNFNKVKLHALFSDLEMAVMRNDFYTVNAQTINQIFIESDITGGGSVKCAFSFDGGLTWCNYTNGEWKSLLITIPIGTYTNFSSFEIEQWKTAENTILENGISVNDIQNIPFNILEIKRFRIAFVFSKTCYADNCFVSALKWNINENDVLTEVSADKVERSIIGNTIVINSNISADKLYVNVTTNGNEPVILGFSTV